MGKRNAIKDEFNEVQLDGQLYMASRPETERLTPNPTDTAWFEAAKESIKLANLSYDNGLYPSAVYNCQQAIEKLVKVLLLSSNVAENMIAIGHNPHKALKEFYEKVNYCDKVEICKKLDKIIQDNKDFKTRFNGILPYFGGIVKEMNRIQTLPQPINIKVENNTKYYQAVLLYLSYLFADTWKDSRYPSSIGNSTIKIADSYNEDIQFEIGKSIEFIESVIKIMESPIRL